MRLISVAGVAPLLLAAVVLSGCEDAPATKPTVTSGSVDACKADATKTPEIGGPLHDKNGGWFRRDLSHKPPSVSMDVGLVPLANKGGEDVVIDRIQLEPQPGTAPLDHEGSFVVLDGDVPMEAVRAGRYPAETIPVGCFHVAPNAGKPPFPYLVLRIATGSAKGISQNRSVEIFYHTLDGTPWIAVFLYQVRFDAPGV